jgi:phosphohistidine phosphatase
MLSLLLMRHAKSTWDEPGLQDHERPLNARGLRDTHLMGEYLAGQKLSPRIILCSSAKRAQQTAQFLVESLDARPDVLFYNELYQSSVATFIELLSSLHDSTLSPVMIVGHNPEIDEAIRILTGEEKHFSTASIAHLKFSAKSWADLSKRSQGKLVDFWRPKDLHEFTD